MTRRPPTRSTRSKRADATRNCERLLAAARGAFREHGADASLEDIARRAGVGIGTLYRHFPTRDALLAEVLRDHSLALVTRAEELARTEPPGPALAAWLEAMVHNVMEYRGLTQSLASNFCPGETTDLTATCHLIAAAGTQLLHAAQASGDIRPDATVQDLMLISNAVAWAAEQSDGDFAQARRLLSMLLDGLRCKAAMQAAAPRRHRAAPPKTRRRIHA